MQKRKIAIDGPAVSGKSSAARRLAAMLGYLYLDSGALYRTLTLAKLRGFNMKDDHLLGRLDLLDVRIVPDPDGRGCRVSLKGEDVTGIIREQSVSNNILPVSGDPMVREWVTDYLRRAAHNADVVMDGRDIGSVVFPDADFKFFITASLAARTRRRLADLGECADGAGYGEIYSLLEKRDHGDRNRKVGPLVQTPDAILIDNSELSLGETVEAMLSHLSTVHLARS